MNTKMEHSVLLLSLLAFARVQSQSSPECAAVLQTDDPCCKMGCPYKTFGFYEVVKECADELKVDMNTTSPSPGTEASECMEECLFSKTKLLTPDLALNAETLKDMAMKSFTGPWVDVGPKLLDECLKTAPGKVAKDTKCKSGSNQLMMCMIRGLFMNCPKENWTESGECKAQRERLEKCPNALPPLPQKRKE